MVGGIKWMEALTSPQDNMSSLSKIIRIDCLFLSTLSFVEVWLRRFPAFESVVSRYVYLAVSCEVVARKDIQSEFHC